MSFRSSASSLERSLALGTLLCALAWGVLEAAALPRTAFFGGRKLAEKFVRLAAMERMGPIDVFVVGPSHVDQGFDAERFGAVTGLRAFNLGVSGTDLYFQSLLVRDVLLPGRAPKAVLWALRDETLSRSNINRQYLEAPSLAYASGPAGRWAFALAQHLPQFQRRRLPDWYGELFRPAAEPLDAFGRTELATLTRQERQAARELGRELRGVRASDEDGEGEDRPSFRGADYAVDLATAQAHVAETLRQLRARGITVWLFFTPCFEQIFTRSSNHARMLLTGSNAAYFDWLTGLAAQLEIPLVDLRYCAEISGEPSYFFDTQHLNALGAAPLGELLGALYAGRRPLPESWLGAPSPAHLEKLLGAVARERVPRLALGVRHGLDQALGVRREQVLLDLYAAFVVERPGLYRVTLLEDEPRSTAGSLYVRFGGPHYELWAPPAEAGRAVVALETRLEPGEHLLELHSSRLGTPIDWDQFLVAPAGE